MKCHRMSSHRMQGLKDAVFLAHRAKLRELASLLEEETQKRLDAEKQKADLELQLKNLTQEQEGQILMDVNVVKEITEAFDAFNCFVALFARGGYDVQ